MVLSLITIIRYLLKCFNTLTKHWYCTDQKHYIRHKILLRVILLHHFRFRCAQLCSLVRFYNELVVIPLHSTVHSHGINYCRELL